MTKHIATQAEIDFVRSKIAAHSVEEGDCLIWQRCMDNATPIINLPRGMSARRQIRVRGFLLDAIMGKPHPKKGLDYRPVATCQNPRCLAQDHQRWVAVSQAQKMTAERTGYHLNPARNAKISKALNRRKLTDEQVQDIRASGRSIKKLAVDHCMSFESMRRIKQGATYKVYNSPWAGLMR